MRVRRGQKRGEGELDGCGGIAATGVLRRMQGILKTPRRNASTATGSAGTVHHLDGLPRWCSVSLGGDGHAPSQKEGKDGSGSSDLGGDLGRRGPNRGK